MRSIAGFCALALAAAGLLLTPVAGVHAQSPATPPATSTTSIPDNKLDAAAAAVKRVSAVRDNFEQQVAKAPAADKERLAGEANDAMKKAVTEQGLSVEEYTTILKVAQNDPSVREKLLQRLK